ncbi:hypothetical protein TNCV_3725881 [Trichonephila clavipes]|nr:hypothetical protein TNCV_3725881 [Trichonephila clavipes]
MARTRVGIVMLDDECKNEGSPFAFMGIRGCRIYFISNKCPVESMMTIPNYSEADGVHVPSLSSYSSSQCWIYHD